ncbi:MAG: ATP-binding protein [Sandaracinaceae bacterium]
MRRVGNDRSAEAALDALVDPVVVCAADGRIQFVNRSAVRLFGRPAEDLVGEEAETLVPERLRELEGQPFFAWLLRNGADQRPVRAPILRPDGLEIHQSFRVGRAAGETGAKAFVTVLREPLQDALHVPDPLHPEAEAPQPESSYRAVWDAVPVGVFHFDAQGVVTACNDVFVAQMGSSRQLLLGLDMFTLPNAEVKRSIRGALEGHQHRFVGTYVSATGGRERQLRSLFSPVWRDEQVAGGVGVVEDITEKTQIEARLAQADRMASLGRLAAGVAHEINNPLAYVRASLELALREVERLEEHRADAAFQTLRTLLGNADEGVERVRVIASDLKTFSRGDEGSWLPVDLRRVVHAAVNLASNEIRHRAALVRELEEVPKVMGSESRFVQVLVNLLVNAAQAIPEGDAQHHRITVRLKEQDGRVLVEVEDTGSGIDPELADRIFEPFWSSKPKGVGTGLGLSICHGIVTSAGGEIRVVRSAPGEGTTIRMVLPPAAESDGRATLPSPPPVAMGPSFATGARILIVDDEPKLATTLRIALADRADLVVAESGRQALEILEADQAFDLILCDLMMPEVGGVDLYEHIEGAAPELLPRFAVMTGGAFTDRAREFLKVEGLRRLEKPFGLEEVEALLRELRPPDEEP